MLLFNTRDDLKKLIYENLNTSYVTLQPSKVGIKSTIPSNLNTSYVTLQHTN